MAQGVSPQVVMETLGRSQVALTLNTYSHVLAEGRTAPPDKELRYILQVRDTHYGFLRHEVVPVSEANSERYGARSVPLIVLLDRQGVIRLHHPGRMTEEDLEAAIQKLLHEGQP